MAGKIVAPIHHPTIKRFNWKICEQVQFFIVIHEYGRLVELVLPNPFHGGFYRCTQFSENYLLSFSSSQGLLIIGLVKSGSRIQSDVNQLERQSGFTKTLVHDTQSSTGFIPKKGNFCKTGMWEDADTTSVPLWIVEEY